ncbi:hypothetical protein [Streptomyces sp. NPDC057877]|uniref:hypothetical protein n=1 Tax=Streptomyces sp. NPDC057877 TaxID=3346269 RepID=UPI0036C1AA29
MPTVTFRDETATGKPLTEWQVPDLPTRMSARDLLRLRVREEVARHNAHPTTHLNGLVRPEEAETAPNGCHLPTPEAAERAFLSNGFFILAGDHQIEDLDEMVDLTKDPTLIFIKLVALAGG